MVQTHADQIEKAQSRRTRPGGPREQLLATMPVAERRLDAAGISTAVLEGGSGPPLVLLHGPGEYAAKWLRVIPDLVKTHRVVVPDLPGHGVSVVTEGTINVDRTLLWLDELIRRTCDSPPTLVGHILGGAIAARYAGDRPGALSRLVLVDALGLAPFQPAPQFGKALMDFVSEPSEETHDRLWELCAFDLNALRAGMGASWDSLRSYNLDRAHAAELRLPQQNLMEAFGLPGIPREELARISVPTTLIWGRHDLATALPVAEEASASYNWPLYVIEDAADDPPLEQPEAFAKTLRTALQSTVSH